MRFLVAAFWITSLVTVVVGIFWYVGVPFLGDSGCRVCLVIVGGGVEYTVAIGGGEENDVDGSEVDAFGGVGGTEIFLGGVATGLGGVAADETESLAETNPL